MRIIIGLFLSYTFYVYLVRPFFEGLLGSNNIFNRNENKFSNNKPKKDLNYTDYEEIK